MSNCQSLSTRPQTRRIWCCRHLQRRRWCLSDSYPETVSYTILVRMAHIEDTSLCIVEYQTIVWTGMINKRVYLRYFSCIYHYRHNDVAKMNKLPLLTLYTKYPCPLCDEAKEVLMKSPFWNQFEWHEVDIRLPENKKWFGRYRYEIPVFHLNGKFLMKHRVDLKLLEQRLLSLTE